MVILGLEAREMLRVVGLVIGIVSGITGVVVGIVYIMFYGYYDLWVLYLDMFLGGLVFFLYGRELAQKILKPKKPRGGC